MVIAHTIRQFRTGLLTAVLFGICASGLQAAPSVEMSGMTKDAVVGEFLGFSLDVTLDNPGDAVDVSGLRLNGKSLMYETAELGSNSSRIVINGRVVKDSSGSRKRYTFKLPSDKPGRFSIPSGAIVVAGQRYQIPKMDFAVTNPPTSTNLLFRTTLLRPQPSYYPSQTVEVLCKLYYRNLSGVKRDSISLPLLDDDHLKLIPEKTNSVLVINNRKVAVTPKQGSNEVFNGKRYQTFSFVLRFRLLKPGKLNFVNLFKVGYNSGKTKSVRDFFGRIVRQPITSPLYGKDSLNILIKELPKKNVPPTFNGAIGDFTVKAIPSTDTDVRVGDPITLAVEVRGLGTWDLVQCPPIDKVQGLTDYFKLSEDLPLGDVSADGAAKTFPIRMRVKSKTISQIPPIPFTYFNIREEAYKTVYSEPVPITVYDSGRTARIVDYTEAPVAKPVEQITKPDATNLDVGEAISEENATVVEDAPEKPAPIRISDCADTALLAVNHAPGYMRLAIPAVGFLAALAIFFMRTVTQSAPSPEKLRKIKAKQAYGTFRKATSHLGGADKDATGFYRDLGRAVRTFSCDRYGISGDVDAKLLDELVDSGRITKDNGGALLALIDEIDNLRYSSDDFKPEQGKALLGKSLEVLKSC